MNNDELYNSLSDRHSTCYYKQDDIPSKDLINTILEESLKVTPIFANLWHHRVDVYGPEYSEDKRDVCIQTVEHINYRDMFDSRRKGQPGIELLHNDLEEFEEAIKTGNVKKNGFSIFEEPVTFNTQVLAPYLLKFTFDPYTFGKQKAEEINPDSNALKGMNFKAHQGAMAQAYAITIIARKYNVDSSFCGCFIMNDFNVNRIWHNDDKIIKFVGLGYKDINCYDGPDSKHGKMKSRPTLNDNVIRWN